MRSDQILQIIAGAVVAVALALTNIAWNIYCLEQHSEQRALRADISREAMLDSVGRCVNRQKTIEEASQCFEY